MSFVIRIECPIQIMLIKQELMLLSPLQMFRTILLAHRNEGSFSAEPGLVRDEIDIAIAKTA